MSGENFDFSEEQKKEFGKICKDETITTNSIDVKDPISGTTKAWVLDEETVSKLNQEVYEDESENENSDWIEEEDFGKFSDKIRPILRKLSSIKIIVKDTIFHFGKWLFLKIKQLLLLIKEKFPNLVTGLVLGFILGLILSSIPVLGWILQGFIVPLLTIVGGVLGLKRDIENNENMGSELLQLITNKIKELFTYLQNGIKSKFSFAK